MRLQDISHLGRPVDLGYPTNRAIAIATVLSFVGLTVLRLVAGDAFAAAAANAAWSAVAVFLGWALAREIDPDGERTAFLGAALTLAAAVVLATQPDIAALFWMLLTLRVVNRSAGRPATLSDTAAVLGLTAWGAFAGPGFVAWVAAAAFALDGWLRPRPFARHRVAALAAVAIGVGASFAAPANPRDLELVGRADWSAGVGLAIGLLFVLRVVAHVPTRAVDDASGSPLVPSRIRAGQGIAVCVLVLGWCADELAAFVPLAAAIAGAAVGPRR